MKDVQHINNTESMNEFDILTTVSPERLSTTADFSVLNDASKLQHATAKLV